MSKFKLSKIYTFKLSGLRVIIISVIVIIFYIHGSVHRESSLITVQQDATVFSLLHSCRQLYLFRVMTPIIRSWYSCNYSFWQWLTGSITISSRCWVGTDSCVSYGMNTYRKIHIWLINTRSCNYSCTSSWLMGVNTRNM